MSNEPVDAESLRMLRHDIRNQLSSIHLALETLRYEVADPTEDINYCIETISSSAKKINELLKEPE
ncbi:MAG: histidine kinase dimerization/phospho-acceptor domain-containing protein [Bacteroidota bacterium]